MLSAERVTSLCAFHFSNEHRTLLVATVFRVGSDGDGVVQMASGKLEISCIRVEQEQPQQMWSISEADAAEFLVDLGKTAFGYGLQNGTIGVYRHTTRLWRVKSKHRLCALTALDVYADGHVRFISGWSNGKVEDRLSEERDDEWRVVLRRLKCGKR